MVAKGGSKLMLDESIQALQDKLVPIATLITPNLDEAQVLANCSINTYADMQSTAEKLSKKFKTNVLIKGGHFQDEASTDCLFDYQKEAISWYSANRINTLNTHGTGCTFSAAIASYLAQGNNLFGAINKAKNYITQAIQSGKHYQLGKGFNPVHHFNQLW
jgi:hydroxymethylpyrimidine/phosphomethylpyrimidine kinase